MPKESINEFDKSAAPKLRRKMQITKEAYEEVVRRRKERLSFVRRRKVLAPRPPPLPADTDFRALGFPYVERSETRHGNQALYFRRAGFYRVRLRAPFGTQEFHFEYRAALERCRQPDNKVGRFVRIERALFKCVKAAATRAKLANREFTLTRQWAIAEVERTNYKCPASGVLFMGSHGSQSYRNPYCPSIDRVDPKGGYTPDNCRIIILALNIAISDWGEKVFGTFAAGYLRKKKKQDPKRRNI